MNCREENEMLIHAYVDGELDLLSTVKLEAHLRDCTPCAQAHKNLQTLRSGISSGALYFKAPNHLAGRVHLALQEADKADAHTSAAVQEPSRRASSEELQRRMWWQFSWAWAGVAAALAMAALVVWRLDPGVSRRSQNELLAQEVLSSHVRSLMANHLTDVPSSDQHTVKPWFNGKLDFSPPVKDLAAERFPLVGGRLDYLDDRPVGSIGLPATQTFHQPLHLAVGLRLWAEHGNAPRLQSVPLDPIRHDLLGGIRPELHRAARIRAPGAESSYASPLNIWILGSTS